jgi:hypothetical protein
MPLCSFVTIGVAAYWAESAANSRSEKVEFNEARPVVGELRGKLKLEFKLPTKQYGVYGANGERGLELPGVWWTGRHVYRTGNPAYPWNGWPSTTRPYNDDNDDNNNGLSPFVLVRQVVSDVAQWRL